MVTKVISTQDVEAIRLPKSKQTNKHTLKQAI